VHRVNECDERKNTSLVNRRLELANRCADRTVFISAWLEGLFERRGAQLAPAVVVRNGADRAIFHAGGRPWDGPEPLRVVTHHWSDHRMKGFDVYERFDRLLGTPDYARRFAFTYIGRLPAGVRFTNARVEAPQHGERLAALLRQHHVYLTASRHEPAGMHHIEGALCGLPLLYVRSGALPEYCEGFGLAFDDGSFEAQLAAMYREYPAWRARMTSYPHDAARMCSAYLALFEELVARRREILAQRRWSRRARRWARPRSPATC
jgi:glycosyltransferase involved in cell wall biosynthesis